MDPRHLHLLASLEQRLIPNHIQPGPPQPDQILDLHTIRRPVSLVPQVLLQHHGVGRRVRPVHAQLRGETVPVDRADFPPRDGTLEHGDCARCAAVDPPCAHTAGTEVLARRLLEVPAGVMALADVHGVGVWDALLEIVGRWEGAIREGKRCDCRRRYGDRGTTDQDVKENQERSAREGPSFHGGHRCAIAGRELIGSRK